MSDWGKGSVNNDIGWGQGASNNSIGWGDVHFKTYAGETDLTGLAGVLTLAFKNRVIDDGGTFEAEQCLRNNLIQLI
jgi:hypothetical protein